MKFEIWKYITHSFIFSSSLVTWLSIGMTSSPLLFRFEYEDTFVKKCMKNSKNGTFILKGPYSGYIICPSMVHYQKNVKTFIHIWQEGPNFNVYSSWDISPSTVVQFGIYLCPASRRYKSVLGNLWLICWTGVSGNSIICLLG